MELPRVKIKNDYFAERTELLVKTFGDLSTLEINIIGV